MCGIRPSTQEQKTQRLIMISSVFSMLSTSTGLYFNYDPMGIMLVLASIEACIINTTMTFIYYQHERQLTWELLKRQ